MPARRSDDDALLDAARTCVLGVGVRRTTLTDIARRAGVSRMTIYRRWPDVRTLVGDLMTREWVAAVDSTRPAPGGPALRRTVEHLVAAVRALRAHPLFRKIIEVDPELLLPYILDRRGASQDAILARIEAELRVGQEEGSIRRTEVTRQARAVLLVAQSFVLSGHTMLDEPEPGLDDLDEELRTLLERYLKP